MQPHMRLATPVAADGTPPSSPKMDKNDDKDSGPSQFSSPLSVPVTPQKPPPGAAPATAQTEILFKSQYHKDAFLIFRALCKLSSKVIDDSGGGILGSGGGGSDPLALHSKALSLSLILGILETCGPAFMTGDKFVYAVRHYLCVSLLKNCMSTNTSIVYLSLRIFVCLVNNFRSHLKHEIEVFVANVFLKVLDSQNSSPEQKCLVLEALSSLSEPEVREKRYRSLGHFDAVNPCLSLRYESTIPKPERFGAVHLTCRLRSLLPQTLSQIFLNYDCDVNATNDLFKNIVNSLARVAKGSSILGGGVKADLDESKVKAVRLLRTRQAEKALSSLI